MEETVVDEQQSEQSCKRIENLAQSMGLYKDGKMLQILRECVDLAYMHEEELTPRHFENVDMLHYFGSESLEQFCASSGVTSESVVVDVGGGVGGPARFVAWRFGCKVHAVEILAHLARTGRVLNRLQKLDHLVQFTVTDFAALPRPVIGELGLRAPASHVITQLCLLHIANKEAVFANVADVLEPGGMFFIEDFFRRDGCAFSDRERSVLTNHISVCDVDRCIINESEYKAVLERNGLEVCSWSDKTFDWATFVWDRFESFLSRYGMVASAGGGVTQSRPPAVVHSAEHRALRSSYDGSTAVEMTQFYGSMAELYHSHTDNQGGGGGGGGGESSCTFIVSTPSQEKYPLVSAHLAAENGGVLKFPEQQALGGVQIIGRKRRVAGQ